VVVSSPLSVAAFLPRARCLVQLMPPQGELNLASSTASSLRSNGRVGRAPAMGRVVPAMGRNGKAVASIVCACASAYAKSATGWILLHRGSAIDWEPGCTKSASGCGMNAGVTGEKMNSPFVAFESPDLRESRTIGNKHTADRRHIFRATSVESIFAKSNK
jgi:hypothetical protein